MGRPCQKHRHQAHSSWPALAGSQRTLSSTRKPADIFSGAACVHGCRAGSRQRRYRLANTDAHASTDDTGVHNPLASFRTKHIHRDRLAGERTTKFNSADNSRRSVSMFLVDAACLEYLATFTAGPRRVQYVIVCYHARGCAFLSGAMSRWVPLDCSIATC